MNADDKERLDVARKLREDAANDELRRQAFVEEIVAGCIGETLYDEYGSVRDVEILTKLADLIDRGTCRNVYNENELPSCRNGFECDVCGNRVEDLEHCAITGKFDHCPGCGRIVVE